jgi:predicted nucleic-acid-binding Zn-ribbon protein
MMMCIKCGGVKFARWDELDDEQKMIVERLPASAEFSLEHRKKHSTWCVRCFYEEFDTETILS